MTGSAPRVTALARVELDVVDLGRSRRFYRDVVGLQEVDPPQAGLAAFRCDSRPYSVLLRAAPLPGLRVVAWAIDGGVSLDALHGRLQARGVPFETLAEPECRVLGVARATRVVEPASGAMHELHLPLASSAAFVASHTAIQRLGHVVLATPRRDDAVAFFVDALGFRVSDRIDGGTTFMRPGASPWHHGLGLAPAAGPGSRLHHVNVMVSTIDDIGRALHRLHRHDVPVVWGPGRHPPSDSVFLYFLDPDGLTLEYSFGMEAFDAHDPRAPHDLPGGPTTVDAWGAPRDPRLGAVGAIARCATAATRLTAR